MVAKIPYGAGTPSVGLARRGGGGRWLGRLSGGVLLWLCLLGPAWGQVTKTWNGSVNSDWFNANNWTPAGVPATNDTINFSSGTINFTAPVTVYGTFNCTGGTLVGTGLTVATNGVLNISGGGVSLNNPLTNAGTVNWQGGAIAICCGGPIINQTGAVWSVQCDQNLYQACCGGAYFQNYGTVQKTGTTGTTSFGIIFNNTGVFTNQSGTVNFNSGGSLGGSYAAASGKTINFAGGTFTYTTPPVLAGAGLIQFSGGSLTLLDDVIAGLRLSGGNLALSTYFQGGTITNLTLSGANLSGSNTISGVFNWNGGNLSGPLTVFGGATLNWTGGTAQGPLLVATNGVLNLTGGGVSVSSTFTNAGTVNWQSGSVAICCGGPILNLPGALWNVQCDQSVYQACCSGGYFENLGTVQKVGTTGTAYFSIVFNNLGVVTNQSGTLNINGGGDIDGVFGAASGTTINFSNGTFTYSAQPQLLGVGLFQFTGGNLTLTDSFIPGLRLAGGTLNLAPTFQGGTITNLTLNGVNLSGDHTVSGVFNWNGGNLSGALTAAPGGTINWTGGTAQGPLMVASNAVLNLVGGGVSVSSTFTNAGTVNWESGSLGVCCGGPIINQTGAVWNVQCDQSVYQSCCSGGYFENDGTVQKSVATGTSYFSIAFNNTGVVTNQSGTLNMNAGGILAGVYGAGAGAALNFGGGSFSYSTPPLLFGPGAMRFTGGSLTLLNDVIPGLSLVGGSISLSPAFQSGTITNLSLPGANLNGSYTVSGVFNCGNGVSGALVVTNGGVLNWSGGNIFGLADLDGATVNWSGGSAYGPLTVAPNAVLNLTGGGVSINNTLTNNGTLNWQSGSIGICCGGPVVNQAGALWNVLCDQSLYQSCCSGGVFQNAGTVQKLANSGTTYFSVVFNNTGMVTNGSGTINFNAGGTLGGSYAAGAGTTINFGGGAFSYTTPPVLTGAGAIRFTGGSLALLDNVIPGLQLLGGSMTLGTNFQGGTITNLTAGGSLNGSYVVSGVFNSGGGVSGNLEVLNGATLNWSGGNVGSLVVDGGGTLNWSGGTLQNAFNIVPGANVNWAGGTAGGPLWVTTNAVLNLTGGGVSVNNTFTNAGTVNWEAGNIGICCGGPFINLPGALLNVQCDQSLYQSCCSGAFFQNQGTVLKSAAGGSTYISLYTYNTGLVTNQSGTLNFNAGASLAGTFGAGQGTTINFSGGNFSYSTVPVLLGPGAIRFTGGSLTLVNDVIPGLSMVGGTITLSPAFQGGTITNLSLPGANLSGNYTVSGVFNCANGVSGALVVTNGAVLNWSGGNISGVADLDGATVNWSGGSAYGPLTVATNGVLNLTGSGVSVNSTLTNAGTVNWESGNIGICCGGPVVNQAGALWNVLCDQSFYQACCSGGSFLNAGTVQKSAATGTTYISVLVYNTGTWSTLSGNFSFNSANVYSQAGATLNFALGVGRPTAMVMSGNLSLDGTLTGGLVNNYVPRPGDNIPLIACGTLANAFNALNLPPPGNNLGWRIAYAGNGVSLQVVTNASTTAQIAGLVQDTNNAAITNIRVFAFTTNLNNSVYLSTTTDGTGHYVLNVTNGVWRVGLQGLVARGYSDVATQDVVVSGANQTANFTVQPYTGPNYTITVSVNPPGAGNATGGGTFLPGSQVTLTATANTNVLPFFFTGWTQNGVLQSTSNPYVFTAQRSAPLVANFTLPQYNVSVANSPASEGTATGAGSYYYGSNAVLTASPNAGYAFSYWGSNVFYSFTQGGQLNTEYPFGSTCTLAQGDTLDFIVSSQNGDYSYLGSGLKATITYTTNGGGVAVYDAVTDFKTNANPAGVWSYGWSTNANGSFQPLTNLFYANGPADAGWWNGAATPNSCVVDKNYTGSTFQQGTVVFEPDTLHLDPQNYAVIVRFTAPYSGTFQVAGLFRLQDTGTHAHNFTVTTGDNLLSTSPTVSVTVYTNLFLVAHYAEAVTTHYVSTATQPPGLATVSGAGVYTNGQSGTFSTPTVLASGGNDYFFSKYVLTNTSVSTSPTFTKTFSTQDASNLLYTAVYTVMGPAPQVTNVTANFPNPAPATTNYQLAFRFDRTMDTNYLPQVIVTNSAPGAVQPVVPAGGHWGTVAVKNDTFYLPPMTFTQGMDGAIQVSLSGGQDLLGGTTALTNVYTIQLDATPPVLSNIAASPAVLSAFVTWTSDKASASMVEYGTTTSYGLNSGWNNQLVTSHGVTLYNLNPLTTYHYRVHSRDLAGNETISTDNSFTTFAAPDLQATSLRVSGTLISGQNILITWADTNAGSGATFSYWYDQVVVTNASTGQTLLNTTVYYDPNANGTIAPGGAQARQYSFQLPNGAAGAGNLQVLVTVNYYANQYEANGGNAYANNTAVLPFSSALAAYPDLQITGLAVTNAQLQSGKVLGLVWNDVNTGIGTVSNAFSDQIVVVNQTTAQTLLTTTLANNAAASPIGPGQSVPRQLSFTLPDGVAGVGTLLISLTADTYNNVFEYNGNGTAKSNNTNALTVVSTLAPYADLVVSNVTGPVTAGAGQSVQVSWVDANIGTAPATNAWVDQIFIADDLALDNEQLLGTLTVTNGLAPNQSLTNVQAVALPAFGAGQKWLVVRADAGNVIYELIKTNNVGVSSQAIGVAPTLALNVSPGAFDQNAANPAASGTLTRSGDVSSSLVVSLSNSDPSSLTVPTTVTIPAGQYSTSFGVTAVPSTLVRGNRTVTLTAAALSYQGATNAVTVLDYNQPTLRVSIALGTVGESYPKPIACTVTRNTSTNSSLLVGLVADATKLTVPGTTTIPAGAYSTTFYTYVVSNALPTRPVSASITANVGGYVSVPATVTIVDDDLPNLSLALGDLFVTENAQNPASQGTITTDFASPVPLKIVLQSDNPLITVPPALQLAAGQTNVTFPITVVNDHLVHGPTNVNLTAFIADGLLGTAIADTGVTNSLTVIDDNGPALSLSLATGTISENGSTTATVTCNLTPTNDLVLALTSSDTSVATVPATATIPAGHTNVSFTVTGVNPGVPTGPRHTSITASASTFATGVAVLNVSDVNLPDLRVASMTLPAAAFASSAITASYSVENDGIWAATNVWTDYVYYSTSPSGANPHFVASIQMTNALAVGQAYTNTVTIYLPPNPAQYYLVVNANSGQALTEISYQNNNLVSSAYTDVQPSYRATVAADLASAPSGTPIPMHGHAFNAQNTSQAAPYVPVTIRVLVKGTRRVFTVNTDINGNFSYVFQPLATEAGSYQLCADHPSVTTDTLQSGFALYGIGFGDGGVVQSTYPNAALTGQVMVQNLGDLPLSGVTAIVEGATPALGIQASVSNTIPASGSVPLSYTVTAGSVSSPVQVQARLHLTSAEGAVAYYPLTITVAPKTATLVANPNSLLSAMLRGSQTLVDFDLKNVGGAASGPIQMLLPQADWLAAACSTNLPSLDPGQSVRITLSLTPSLDLALQPYNGTIEFVAGNTSLNVPFQFRAISDQVGDVQVTAQDDYTFYVAGAPLVTNAAVTLTDPYADAVVATGATDASGQVLLTNIHEGTYQMVVSADHHNSYQSPVTILSGRTNQVTAFLARQTVTYQWTVVPTQIQDNYQVVLESVFETEVPIPVVTVDNPLQIPLIAPGQDTEMDIQISNHGLIEAQGVHFELPTDDPDHEFVVLTTNIDIVPAMSTITVPVIVRARTNSPSYQARVFHVQPRDGTTITGCPKLPKLTLKWGYVCGDDFNWHAVDTEIVPVDVTQSCIDAIEDRLKDILKDLAKGGDWKDLLKWKDQLCALTDALEACGADPCAVSFLRLACGLDSGSFSGALGGALNMGNCFCPSIPSFGSPGATSVTPPPIGSSGGGSGSLGPFNGYVPPVNGVNWDWVYSGCTPGQTLGNPSGSVARQVVFGPQPRGGVTTSAGAVCAQVRIRIEQQAVVARAAFLGTLTIDNGDPNSPLTNIQVTLDIRDLSQNPANDAFGITGPVLLGMTATDGTGRIEPGASGSAKFTFVPTHSAAPTVPMQYKIGGTLQYYQNDSLVQVPLLPQQITVFPDPVLHLLYFQQRDVYGDDPFTPQVEPSEPFDLGLMVTNSGYGKCFNFTITSGQPKIVDNQKGLLINFSLIGTEVGSNNITPSLTANLGEIDPGGAKVGAWEMISTLQGHFIEYTATFQHIDSLGNPETSLIDSVEIHELIHKVKTDRLGDDAVPDFLVNDIPDPESLPDTLYLSDGSSAPVNVVTNAIVDGAAAPGHMQVQLTTTMGSGWNYLQIPDPGAGYILTRVMRSDGKQLLVTNNVWTTDRSFPSSRTGVVYENLLHLFDWAGPGVYTLYYHSTNTTPPALVAVGPVTPFTQSGPVSAVTVSFSELVDTTTFSAANVSLTRNGGSNLITNGTALSLTLLSNTTYAISGLAPFTAAAGNYQITVFGNGIYDLWANNAGNVSAATQWANGNAPVVVQSFSALTPNPRNTPITSVTVTFSKTINAATFNNAALFLTLNSGPNLITSDVTITPASGNSFTIGGLAALTGAQGNYVLTVNAAAVQDTGGIAGFGSQSVTWTTITSGPTITSLEPITTNPRNIVVRTLNVGFSEPIDPSTFDYRALTLTRDGGANLITSDVTVTPLGSTAFQVGNINWVQGYQGTYSFTVDATQVADLAGNPGTGSTNESWQIILEIPPTPTNLVITPDLGISSTDGLTSTNNITLLGTVGASNLTIRVFDSTTSTDLGTAAVSGTNFSAALSFSTQGLHHLRTSATDVAGNVSGYSYIDLFVDTVPPTASIQPVANPSYGPVTNIVVTFSEPINTNTLSATNFVATLNGTTTFTPTLTRLSPSSFLLGNLSAFTAGGGTYQVTLNPAGIQDYAGNVELTGAATVWTNLNLPPVISPLTNMTVTPGNLVSFRVSATDPRALSLTYSLAAGAPAGASLNTTNGTFNWMPNCSDGGTTNPITIWVADHGSPALSNSVSLLLMVRDCVQITAGTAVVQSGQGVCLPVDLLATDGLTNLSFTLSYPTNRFSNWAISLTNSSVNAATAQVVDPTHTLFNIVTKPGQVLQGNGLRAWVCLNTVPGGSSAFVPIGVTGINGRLNDGSTASTTFGVSGRVTVVGTEPLLEAGLGVNPARTLTLYGLPGTNYTILWTTNLRSANWQFGWNVPMTNLVVTFPVTNPAPVQFYRARTQFPLPQFVPVPDIYTPAGAALLITNSVTNLPLSGLTFSLSPSAPAGAAINPTNGTVTWTPTCSQGSSSNRITLWATYNAIPPVSNSLSFNIFVGDCLQVGLGAAALQTGQGTCIPVSLLTSVGLTNLGFELTYPSNRFGSWSVTATNPAVGSASVQTLDPAHAQVFFSSKPGQLLQGPTSLGTLCFQALSGASAFIEVQTGSVLGSKDDGLSVANATGQATRLTVVGTQPLLEASLGGNKARFLTLYGNPGTSYEVDYATNLLNGKWQLGWRVPMTNIAEVFPANTALPQVFYRALEFSANPPILELNSSVRSNLVFLVYGQKGSNYTVLTGTNLANPATWSPVVGFTLTNSFQFVPVTATNRTQFFRAKRP